MSNQLNSEENSNNVPISKGCKKIENLPEKLKLLCSRTVKWLPFRVLSVTHFGRQMFSSSQIPAIYFSRCA